MIDLKTGHMLGLSAQLGAIVSNLDEKDVKNFCELTFGVNFPMTSITAVRGTDAHPFYKWAKVTYGNKTIPKWNFHKLLINKEGKIVETYSSTTKPTSEKVITKIENLL